MFSSLLIFAASSLKKTHFCYSSMTDLTPRITDLPTKLTVGVQLTMSVAQNRTAELWSGFAPRLKEVKHRSTNELISLQEYDPEYLASFDPGRSFVKRALAEVTEFREIPHGLEKFVLPGGLYAVFLYKGLPGDPSVFEYIYGVWLQESGYELDHRPHFEVLGPKYKQNSPDSEEELYIPIR